MTQEGLGIESTPHAWTVVCGKGGEVQQWSVDNEVPWEDVFPLYSRDDANRLHGALLILGVVRLPSHDSNRNKAYIEAKLLEINAPPGPPPPPEDPPPPDPDPEEPAR